MRSSHSFHSLETEKGPISFNFGHTHTGIVEIKSLPPPPRELTPCLHQMQQLTKQGDGTFDMQKMMKLSREDGHPSSTLFGGGATTPIFGDQQHPTPCKGPGRQQLHYVRGGAATSIFGDQQHPTPCTEAREAAAALC